jgi:hypothetical protein
MVMVNAADAAEATAMERVAEVAEAVATGSARLSTISSSSSGNVERMVTRRLGRRSQSREPPAGRPRQDESAGESTLSSALSPPPRRAVNPHPVAALGSPAPELSGSLSSSESAMVRTDRFARLAGALL